MKIRTLIIISFMLSISALAAVKADNTEVNKRDRQNQEITADKHGASEKDIKISADLRQLYVNDKSLSVYAQNVKIITINGEVTLKGPVQSLQEQRSLVSMAKKVSGVSNVLNKTEVVTK
jgi:hyperosmotically inducible protein